jgi:D-arabinose 1-dehydrogenase-like Zn-dependent alcohol dehydrogenase
VVKKFRAVGIFPNRADLAGYHELSRNLPRRNDYSVVVHPLAVKFCDTDKAVANGTWAGEPGADGETLVTGHETVVMATDDIGDKVQGIEPGKLYMRTVRIPRQYPADGNRIPPVDMMELGMNFIEAGIFGLDGGLVEQTSVDYRSLIAVPDGIPLDLLPFIETASCPFKAVRHAENIRTVFTQDFQSDPLPKLVMIPGATGKSGGVVVKMFQMLGYEVVAIGRKEESDSRVQRLTQRGVKYERFSESPNFTKELRAKYGDFRLMFDLTGNVAWINSLLPAMAYTSATIAYSIPSERQIKSSDLATPWLDIVLGNKLIVGSVNASPADWQSAITLLQDIAISDPKFLLDGIHKIPSLDVRAINSAINDPNVQVPLVYPNPHLIT